MLPTNRHLFLASERHEQFLATLGAPPQRKTLLERIRLQFLGALHTVWYPLKHRLWDSPLAYEMRSEMRCILPRIRFRLEPKRWHDLTFGPSLEETPNGGLVPCKRTFARIHDMQVLATTHPWLDVVEQRFFLQGWDAGARWAENNARSSGKESSPVS